MPTLGLKRKIRIDMLYQRALRKKYTHEGKFFLIELIKDAESIGVVTSTACSYADSVIDRLQRAGHLK